MESVIREGALRLLLINNATCDVILSCPGQKLMAHKVILSMASPVFKDLLDGSTPDPSVIIFPDVHSTTMALILDYIYSGKVVLYPDTVRDFLCLAKLLEVHVDPEEVPREESRKPRREIPSLIPIGRVRSKARARRRALGHVPPSPWCPNVERVLGDPKREQSQDTFNDTNNNVPSRSTDPNSTTVIDLKITSTTQPLKGAKHEKKEEEKREEDKDREKPYKCQDCGKSFSQVRNYKYHRSVHEGTKEFAAKCPECGKTFNDKGYLSSHMKIHRDRKEYACPYCPKRFNQRVAYNMHLRIHTGVKPHECPTCGKSFSRKMLLKQHQRVHTGERPYSCPECGKTFADRSNMSLHARLHTGVKPYECNLCPKSFTKKHHLKTHMNFHTGLKPYKCEKCGLAFSQSSNMRTHYKKCLLKNQDSKSDNGSS